MEIFFGLMACVVSAAGVYYVLEYQMFGERQQATTKLLRAQADAVATQKAMAGYTKFAEYLPASKQVLIEKLKLSAAKVVREYVHVENLDKEANKLKTVVTVIIRYSVEFSFGFDLKPENFDLIQNATGIEVHLAKPTFTAAPKVKKLSHEVPIEGALADEPATVDEIQRKLLPLAVQYGMFVATDPAVLALCEIKVIEVLRSFLVAQAGVKQVPGITVTFK
jgi:hypothetical protein